MIKIGARQAETLPFLFHLFLFLFKPGAYITHNATYQLNDITGGNLSDYMQIPLEPQQASHYFFHMQ